MKNTGFIRVNVRGSKMELEVYIRNVSRAADTGKIFALVYNEGLIGIELNEIEIKNGQSDSRIVIETEDIKNSSFSLHDVEGIGIRWDSGLYIASCWKDTYAGEIAGGEFRDTEELKQALILEPMACPNTEQMPVTDDIVPLLTEELFTEEHFTTYEKIDLSQIRDLPSPNWHLATNSFLVHGFWNYGYLVLKKNVEEGQKMLSLGVPGIYEKPEAVMAVLFGFPNFEAVSEEMVAGTKEKNQETKEGTFGCWFVDLKM